jgi:hypothetical protein
MRNLPEPNIFHHCAGAPYKKPLLDALRQQKKR